MTNLRPQRETRTTTTSTRRTSSSTTTVSHGPGCVSPEDLQIIRDCYVECVGEMTAPVARMIEQKLCAGMAVPVILHAIEETGWAPRPSAQYLRAILTRLHSMDILTPEDLEADMRRYEQRQQDLLRSREERWY